MNKFTCIGNLTADPELTETQNGIKICRFCVAVNRKYTDDEGERVTDFFNCVAFRGLAETMERYTHKGDKVCVCGEIELRNYEDKNGNKRLDISVIVGEVEFLSQKQQSAANETKQPPSPVARKPLSKKQTSIYDKQTREPLIVDTDDDFDCPF